MNLKEAKEKYIQLGEAIENLQQNSERHNLLSIYSALGQYLTNELKYEWDKAESPSTNYDEDFGDDKLCNCGHPYYRHFDSYDNNRHVGCKYCECFHWNPMDSSRKITTVENLNVFDVFKRLGDNHASVLYVKTPDRTVCGKIFNTICLDSEATEGSGYSDCPVPITMRVEKITKHKDMDSLVKLAKMWEHL